MATGPLHVLPIGPVACGSLVWRAGAVLRASVQVKATFQLVDGGDARLVDPLEIDAACEAAPYLPSAGVVLTGVAHAPYGLPTPAMAVRLAVHAGERPLFAKLLHVLGDRSMAAPTPRAFEAMPLSYERAYGGPGVEDNPVGVGGSVAGALPNVVDPADPRRPAGYGPLAAAWGHRRRLLRRAAAPEAADGVLEVADDLDFRYFHAAPPDQQVELLAGDEWIAFDGLHPVHGRFRSRLPSARAVAEVHAEGAATRLDLVADTLVIDAVALVASIVWRAQLPLASLEAAAGLRVFAGVELPGSAVALPAPVATAARRPRVDAFADDRTMAVSVDLKAARAALPFARGVPAAKAARSEADDDMTRPVGVAELRQALDKRPIAPFELAAPRSRPEAPARAIPGAPWSAVPVARPPELDGDTTAGVRPPPPAFLASAQAAREASFALPPPPPPRGASPWISPAASAPAPAPAPAEPVPPRARIRRRSTAPPPPLPPPAMLGPLPLASLAAATDDPGRARVQDRLDRRASLDGVVATGADLSGLDLSGQSMVRAKLAGARLDGVQLVGADLREIDLCGASLAGARFTRARLDDANLVNARADGAVFDAAKGRRVDLGGASLVGASLREAELPAVSLRGAALGGARFDGAHLAEAQLGDASGGEAVFDDARLPRAQGKAATLPEASFRRADLSGSAWDRADLTKAAFDGANLRGASLARARCDGARFIDADLGDANLERAHVEGADFAGASLEAVDLRKARAQGASFAGANLSEANAERADLRDGDLRGAVLRGAKLDGAQTAGAKLDDPGT